MSPKVYAKPPKTIFVAQIIIISLFMMFGLAMLSFADREVRIFVAMFVAIWEAGCIALLVNAIKTLKLIRNGKLEIAEISGMATEEGNSFAVKLRELEALKKEGLISEDEYQKKREKIMQEKW